jgi:hypothetical protein
LQSPHCVCLLRQAAQLKMKHNCTPLNPCSEKLLKPELQNVKKSYLFTTP